MSKELVLWEYLENRQLCMSSNYYLLPFSTKLILQFFLVRAKVSEMRLLESRTLFLHISQKLIGPNMPR